MLQAVAGGPGFMAPRLTRETEYEKDAAHNVACGYWWFAAWFELAGDARLGVCACASCFSAS